MKSKAEDLEMIAIAWKNYVLTKDKDWSKIHGYLIRIYKINWDEYPVGPSSSTILKERH